MSQVLVSTCLLQTQMENNSSHTSMECEECIVHGNKKMSSVHPRSSGILHKLILLNKTPSLALKAML